MKCCLILKRVRHRKILKWYNINQSYQSPLFATDSLLSPVGVSPFSTDVLLEETEPSKRGAQLEIGFPDEPSPAPSGTSPSGGRIPLETSWLHVPSADEFPENLLQVVS